MNCGSTVKLYKARGRAVRFADTASTDQVVNDWKGDASLVHPKGILRSRSQSPRPGAGRGKRGKAGGKGRGPDHSKDEVSTLLQRAAEAADGDLK
eukprot:7195991-Pyramimonas_sp.AAC.1